MIRVSPSTLSTFARCRLKAFLRTSRFKGVLTADEESTTAPLEAGKAAHRVLYAKLSGKSDDEALAELDAYRAFADSQLEVNDRLGYANVKRVLAAYFRQRALDNIIFVAMFPEREFQVPLSDDKQVTLIGRFDVAVVKMKSSGALWIMEHKTTGTYLTGQSGDTWFRQWRTDGQVSALVYAARKLGLPVTGLLLNAIGLHRLPVSDRKCGEHGVAYSECWEAHLQTRMQPEQRDEATVENWRHNAVAMALELESMLQNGRGDLISYAQGVRQEGMFNGSCTYCEFNRFCHSGNRTNPQWLAQDTNPEGITRSGLVQEDGKGAKKTNA